MLSTEARRKELDQIVAKVEDDARANGVELDSSADFTLPPAAPSLAPQEMYVKLLSEQRVLGDMVGEQQVCCSEIKIELPRFFVIVPLSQAAQILADVARTLPRHFTTLISQSTCI